MRYGLKVRHRGREKMVGSLFTLHPSGVSIFYHESSRTQWHPKYDSPGGIDETVLAYCLTHKIARIHHWITPEGPLYVTDPETVIRYGIEEHSDGRDRLYLPVNHWHQSKQRLYTPAWVTTFLTLDPLPERVSS